MYKEGGGGGKKGEGKFEQDFTSWFLFISSEKILFLGWGEGGGGIRD